MALGPIWMGSIAVAGLSALAAGALAVLYARSLARAPTPFGGGLLMFAVLLVVQSAGAAWAYVGMAESFGPALGVQMLALSGLELAAVLALVWATMR